MSTLTAIMEAVGQVRSELRVVRARNLPTPSRRVVNEQLVILEQGIRRFKFGLPGELRGDPQAQAVIRSLHRLHEDLLHELGQGSDGDGEANGPEVGKEGVLVMGPLAQLVLLINRN